LPLQQTVTPYLEATGNTASVNTVKLVARVQGYVQEIKYKDGAQVKKGTPLFVIEPEPYKVKLDQAKAAEEGAQATLVNAQAGLKPDDRVVVAGILDAIPGQKVDPQRQTPKAAAMEPTAGQAGSK